MRFYDDQDTQQRAVVSEKQNVSDIGDSATHAEKEHPNSPMLHSVYPETVSHFEVPEDVFLQRISLRTQEEELPAHGGRK